MKKNIGGIDRVLRIVLGLAILFVGYRTKTWLGLIGLVPLLTAVIAWCPLYVPLGINSCKKKD